MSKFCITTRRSATRAALWALVAGFAWPAHADPGEAPPASNRVELRARIRGRGGVVRCGLFRQAGWLKVPVASAAVRADAASVSCVFTRVAPGTYGLSAFHDKNDNGKLDTNLLAIPSEDYGASRDARSLFGPPRFDDAKFDYRGGLLRLDAGLR